MQSRRPALETPAGSLSDDLAVRLRLPRAVRAAAAPAVVLALAAAWALVHGIDHRFISFSDGVYMYAVSVAAAHGLHELYSGVALSLPPASAVAATLIWKLSPHVETIRIALAATSAVTALLTYRVARTLFGLGTAAAVLAAFVALTGPVHAQFVGLEGEIFVTPLALGLALALNGRRQAVTVAILAAGFLCKLTWAPFFVLGVVALALRRGPRRAALLALSALALAIALYAILAWSFGWSAHDLVTQLLLAQSHSGSQLGLAGGIAVGVLVMWWPLLLLARPGWSEGVTSARLMIAAGAVSSLFMLKQGTFFNVLDPLEPFLAVLAVAGACALWRRRRRVLVALCALGLAVHVASVTRGPLAAAFPVPLGAAIVDTDNQGNVDRVVRTIAANSRADQPVLVNPLFALVAHRREPENAVDWFILRSLERYCGGKPKRDRHCNDWRDAKAASVAVVGVDRNVVSFDSSFRADTGVQGMRRLLGIDAPPIKTTLYAR
jgi:hypothetical protein